jgi:hypothetical protein
MRLVLLLLTAASVLYFAAAGLLGLGVMIGRWDAVLALVVVALSPVVVLKWRRGSTWHRSDKYGSDE